MGKSNGVAKSKPREVEDRFLPVKLTEVELLERAEEMAAAELGIEQLQSERLALTHQVNDAKKTRAKLAHTIDCGTEDRTVCCAWHEDFAKNVWRLKREDTGEEVDTRPMTALDRTGELPFGNDGPDDEPPPPPRSPGRRPRGKKTVNAAA